MDKKKIQETWEIQVKGTVFVYRYDARQGTYVQVRVNGSGQAPKRVTITQDDREYYESLVPAEKEHLNPFTNGMLSQVVNGELTGLTDEALAEALTIEDDESFREYVGEITNELTARRLFELAKVKGRLVQYEIVRDHIDEHWRVGGTQATVAEMFDSDEFKTVRG